MSLNGDEEMCPLLFPQSWVKAAYDLHVSPRDGANGPIPPDRHHLV